MTFPIEPHPTWDFKDPSKMSTFLTCKRKFFYEYLLGWRHEIQSHDAYFGEAWHKAREHMLLHGYDDTLGAYEAFEQHYRLEYDEESDDMHRPKTPEGVLMALMEFPKVYNHDLDDNRVHYTEISGTVPVDEKRVMHFRMDSVLERVSDGMIWSMDHKTTKRFSRQWEDYFFLSLQTGTYTHCLYCMYPIDRVKGVEYCGTCFEFLQRASKISPAGYRISFKRVPAWKTPEQMNSWLWEINDLLDDLEREMDRLYHCSDDDRVMMAFPRNPESCTKYFGCIFHDFCMSWSNPLQHCFDIPLGFRLEYWDPAAMETTNKKELKWKS